MKSAAPRSCRSWSDSSNRALCVFASECLQDSRPAEMLSSKLLGSTPKMLRYRFKAFGGLGKFFLHPIKNFLAGGILVHHPDDLTCGCREQIRSIGPLHPIHCLQKSTR